MSVFTIVGDGRAPHKGNPSTFSSDGAPALSPIGGGPWGVTIFHNQLYFSAQEQGYIGRLYKNQVQHLVNNLKGPMTFAINDDGIMYIPEYGADRITIVTPDGERTTALEGIVKNPMSVRYVNGQYFIVDTGHHRILRWDPISTEYFVIAGTGVAGYKDERTNAVESPLFYPIDMDINPKGEIVIADGMNNRLRYIDSTGDMFTIAGSGAPCLTSKNSLDPCSNQFVGDGVAVDVTINWPFSPRFDSKDNIWFIDANNNLIRIVDVKGNLLTMAGQAPYPQTQDDYYKTHQTDSFNKDVGDGSNPLAASFYRPMGLTIVELDSGTIDCIVADTDNQRIRLIEFGGINS